MGLVENARGSFSSASQKYFAGLTLPVIEAVVIVPSDDVSKFAYTIRPFAWVSKLNLREVVY